jgi:hypothetical protein
MGNNPHRREALSNFLYCYPSNSNTQPEGYFNIFLNRVFLKEILVTCRRNQFFGSA